MFIAGLDRGRSGTIPECFPNQGHWEEKIDQNKNCRYGLPLQPSYAYWLHNRLTQSPDHLNSQPMCLRESWVGKQKSQRYRNGRIVLHIDCRDNTSTNRSAARQPITIKPLLNTQIRKYMIRLLINPPRQINSQPDLCIRTMNIINNNPCKYNWCNPHWLCGHQINIFYRDCSDISFVIQSIFKESFCPMILAVLTRIGGVRLSNGRIHIKIIKIRVQYCTGKI